VTDVVCIVGVIPLILTNILGLTANFLPLLFEGISAIST